MNKTENNTWIFSDCVTLLMVGFDENKKVTILDEGFLEVDELDGSIYDSDGDGKKLSVKHNNGFIYFETLPEDYDYWNGSENCNKEGCLGYVEELLNELKDYINCEYNIESTKNSYNSEVIGILRHIDSVKQKHPELFPLKEKQSNIKRFFHN